MNFLNKIKNLIMDKPYDSLPDTYAHIRRVNQLLGECAVVFIKRGQIHDQSKLNSPEKEYFDEWTPKLAALTYGSDEYKAALKELKPALDHHYMMNRHHPEYFENGIDGMNLFDVIEMLMDWKAASERHNDGSIVKSIEINIERFKISPQLASIIKHTARAMFREYSVHEIKKAAEEYKPLDFEGSVMAASKDWPVILKFEMENCSPCQQIAKPLKEFAEKHNIPLYSVDGNIERDLAQTFKVRGVPRVLIFFGGKVHWDSADSQYNGPYQMVNNIYDQITSIIRDTNPQQSN